jgi:hypothetical protein
MRAPAVDGTLKTPSIQSEFTANREEASDPPALIVQVGKTELGFVSVAGPFWEMIR